MFLERERRGFTLIEIMVVAAIVGLLATLAVPLLHRVRMNANEGAIKRELRTFSSACEGYRAGQNFTGYPVNIAVLADSANDYLDSSWLETDRPRHGYDISYLAGASSYSLLATPSVANQTAVNTYCIDQTGVIFGSLNGEDAPVGDVSGCIGGTALSG